MRKYLVTLAVLAAAPLLAQMPTAALGSKNVKNVTGGSYSIDPDHTLVGWRVDHLGFNDYLGLFGSPTGSLTLDPKNPNSAKLEVTIPVSKVTTASAGLTAHLLKPAENGKKPDFFGANPADAKFVSTKVVSKGTRATITGNLTLNGVTKPVTLNASFAGAGNMPKSWGGKENIGFHAKGGIKRSQFGIDGSLPLVGDTVTLDISAAFVKN